MDQEILASLIQAYPALKESAGTLLEKAFDLSNQFKNRRVLFLEDTSEMEEVLKIDKSAEMKAYKQVLEDKNWLVVCSMGIRLRHISGDREKVSKIREKVREKHGVEGLWAAEAIQAGALFVLIKEEVLGKYSGDQSKDAVDFLNTMSKSGFFVKEGQVSNDVSRKVLDHINGFRPNFVLVAGAGGAAATAKDIAETLIVNVSLEYDYASNDSGGRFAILLHRK